MGGAEPETVKAAGSTKLLAARAEPWQQDSAGRTGDAVESAERVEVGTGSRQSVVGIAWTE